MMLVPEALRLVSMVELLCTIRLDGSFQLALGGNGLAAGAGVWAAALQV